VDQGNALTELGNLTISSWLAILNEHAWSQGKNLAIPWAGE